MNRFHLQHGDDESVAAEGVEFSDGTVVVRWVSTRTAQPTTVIHPSMVNVHALHEHQGNARVVWLDVVR